MCIYKFTLFTLLSFVLTFCSAQDRPELDLFAKEGVVRPEELDMEFYNTSKSSAIGVLNSNLNTAIGIMNNFQGSFYSVKKNDLFERLDTTNVDSILSLLKTGRAEDIYKFTDSLYRDTSGLLKGFFDLGKRVEGNLQNIELIKQNMVFLRPVKRNYAWLTYNATFAKVRGMLEIYFRVSDDSVLRFAKLVFTPFDNQPNVFLNGIALNDIELIKNKDFNTLENNFSSRYREAIGKKQEHLEKQLERTEIKNLLTFRIFIRNEKIYLVPTFNTSREQKAFTIRYVLEEKKFIIDRLAVIDKLPKDQ